MYVDTDVTKNPTYYGEGNKARQRTITAIKNTSLFKNHHCVCVAHILFAGKMSPR